MLVNLDPGRTYWINDPQASQCGGHFELIESIGFVFVEIPERAFKLFKLCRGEVCHITGYDLPRASGWSNEGREGRVQT